MNRDDIIRMAREADLIDKSVFLLPHQRKIEAMERFAALVAAAERELLRSALRAMPMGKSIVPLIQRAVLQEREACAKDIETYDDQAWFMLQQDECAAAIRARK